MEIMAQLDIPDKLAAGPRTAAQVAEEAGSNPEFTLRLLRAAVAGGLLSAERQEGELLFSNNAVSEHLTTSHPASMRGFVRHWAADCFSAWGTLGETVVDGRHNFPKANNGQEVWDYLAERPENQEDFNAGMKSVDGLGLAALIADFDWERFDRYIDVGGAFGSVLNALLVHNPKAHGVLFDQPHVATAAEEGWAARHSHYPGGAVPAERVDFVGGSFFDASTLPQGKPGDAFVLRNVLHDWSDEDSLSILKALRSAIGSSGAALVLLEMSLLDDVGDPMGFARYHMDMHMMAMCHGKERTKKQWEALLSAAGFQLVAMRPTRSIFWAVEAKPVEDAAEAAAAQ
ncbi:Chavicol O-methyltransferase [Monoraphidium neglectum]|uniref:Chavicol O-methyltransferase n=1 Tax=Monoraphidium neglectum TaxID=145388 RepID=A0A0D2LDN7_9CHLO|nr:Chavicol O-methyltransferase [Monoraphidium neglectum]KIZ04824.1 Chavicol O-methyltransferase [Monoraphidium neglectum]|eukprot:XP_013903843.1 Chavicol O-methyltransferase [Monoraphidium neglectum]